MQGKLIAELREWWDKRPLVDYKNRPAEGSLKLDEWSCLFHEILSRHEAEQGEGLREWVDKSIEKYKNGNSTFEGGAMQVLNTLKFNILNGAFAPHPTPDKAVEPLAVLAKRKGFNEVMWSEYPQEFGISIRNFNRGVEDLQVFGGEDYSEAESKARAYLTALPEVKL